MDKDSQYLVVDSQEQGMDADPQLQSSQTKVRKS